ncbi:maltoporin [Pontiella sulfatireligans]|uniref:Maltoporin n=1 Tax=Pontiella sulfatireligans TaxID=2750658 RepID=A0A6C2ULX2_9BACT|nr:carbohydrate porin [Pontiella sulfatireligans]VGO21262.1 Maltoporin [Pontiella sulfatireligans]
MKRLVVCTMLAALSAHAAENTDALRKEFEAYKQASDARIQALEQEVAEKQEATLTEEELATIRNTLARATLDFEFHGYMRAGYGVDDSGGAMSTFQAPNSGAKYRLGNEDDSYLETTFLTRTAPEDAGEDVSFETIITLAYSVPISNGNDFDSTTSLREAYAVATGIVADSPDMSFWAGQRFYSRYDVHMNDFYYRDMSGYGGGVEGISIGENSKLAIAWLGGSIDELDSDGSAFEDPDDNFNKNSLDFALTDTVMPGGTLDVFLTLANFAGDTFTQDGIDHEVDDSNGAAISLMYKTPVKKTGSNILSLQYGTGAAANFRAQMTVPNGLDLTNPNSDFIDTDNARTWRVLDDITYDINEKWSLHGLALYEESDYGVSGPSKVKWASLGARPIYHFNRYFSLATEAGYDYTDTDGGNSGGVYKLTFAPQITPKSTVLSRPAIRAFFTYAWWDSDFKGEVASSSYNSDTHGLSAGMQVETWW